MWKSKGENNKNAKLTAKEVEKIRFLYKFGKLTQAELGAKFGVGGTSISRIVRGVGWVDD